MVGDFVKDRGYLTLGSRFKRLGERLQGEVQELARAEGFDVPAGLFPAIGALDEAGSLTIGELAATLGHLAARRDAQRREAREAGLGQIRQNARRPADQGGHAHRRVQGARPGGQARSLAARRAGVAEICDGLDGSLLEILAAIERALDDQPLHAGPRSPGATAMHELDRPIWHALATRHREFAQGSGLARRYDPLLSPFAASRDDAPASLAALAALVPHSGMLVLLQAGAGARAGRLRGRTRRPWGPDAAGRAPAQSARARGDRPRRRRCRRHAGPGEPDQARPFPARHPTARPVRRHPRRWQARRHGRRTAAGSTTTPRSAPSARIRTFAAGAWRRSSPRSWPSGSSPAANGRSSMPSPSNRQAIRLYEQLGFVKRCDMAVLALKRDAMPEG